MFNLNKTHLNPSLLVGAHGNAPDDQCKHLPTYGYFKIQIPYDMSYG
jgi:hypothetical protein